MDKPKGVLAMILVDGRVGATATDFDTFTVYRGEGGVLESQKIRARAAVGCELVKTYGGPIMDRLISDDESKQLAYDIFCGRKPGFTYVEQLIGYEEDA